MEQTRVRKHGRKVTNSNGDNAVKVAAIRDIVTSATFAIVDGVTVDLTTASTIIAVHDALNPENRAKFSALPVANMASVAFKLVK